jgi:DNA-binding MarR family transcriptional regulator
VDRAARGRPFCTTPETRREQSGLHSVTGEPGTVRKTGQVTTENDARPTLPPPTSTSIVLLTLAHRIESELGAALAPLGLTVSRLGLLGHIAGVPGASFSDLSRMSGISVQSVHVAVKTLAGAGLVRDNTARAGAASTIELTPAGSRLLEQAMTAVSRADDGRRLRALSMTAGIYNLLWAIVVVPMIVRPGASA